MNFTGMLIIIQMNINVVKVKVTQSCLTLCDHMNCIVHGILQARILEWVAFPFSRGSSQPRNQTQVSHIADRFFYQLSHKGSSGILEAGSLSLLQQIFLTQESNQDLLHCRRICYQLSYEGSPHSKLKYQNLSYLGHHFL